MKLKGLFYLFAVAAIGFMVAAGCEPTNPVVAPQITNITFTECNKNLLKSADGTTDRVDVEFTNAGVNITHYGLEVNCAFDTVLVTQNLQNGVLNITEQGEPNNANCICHTDVSYSINGISKNNVDSIIINGEVVWRANEPTEQITKIHFSITGGRMGDINGRMLNISADSLWFWAGNIYDSAIPCNIEMQTSSSLWAQIVNTCNISILKKVQSGNATAPVDGIDDMFTITTNKGEYNVLNGYGDAYEQLSGFFNQIYTLVKDLSMQQFCCRLDQITDDYSARFLSIPIDAFFASIKDANYTDQQKIQSFVDWLNIQDCIVDAQIICVSCITTLPAQSEISITFLKNGQQVTKILDIIMYDIPHFSGMHD